MLTLGGSSLSLIVPVATDGQLGPSQVDEEMRAPFGRQARRRRPVLRCRQRNVPEATIARFAGRPMDHLPLVEEDWTFTTWAMAEIKRGAWGRPHAIALVCGGVGPLWEATMDTATLADQVPRLARLIADAR